MEWYLCQLFNCEYDWVKIRKIVKKAKEAEKARKEAKERLSDFEKLLGIASTGKYPKNRGYKRNPFIEAIVSEYVFLMSNYFDRLTFAGRNVFLQNVKLALRHKHGYWKETMNSKTNIDLTHPDNVNISLFERGAYTARKANRLIQHSNAPAGFNTLRYSPKVFGSIIVDNKKYWVKHVTVNAPGQTAFRNLLPQVVYRIALFLEKEIGGPVITLDEFKRRMDRLNRIMDLATDHFKKPFRAGRVPRQMWDNLSKDIGYLSWQNAILYMDSARKKAIAIAKERNARAVRILMR